MNNLKKILYKLGIGISYIGIIYFTFNAVGRVNGLTDPLVAKNTVLKTFFADAGLFAVSGYLFYKLKKFPQDK
ncbi:MAG TPA: hypothetical protein VJ440_02300 [Candidatus Brocadiaceae bacterium]|nr:hypothetical protein [Candidatus Brocadiaceae bacterium]